MNRDGTTSCRTKHARLEKEHKKLRRAGKQSVAVTTLQRYPESLVLKQPLLMRQWADSTRVSTDYDSSTPPALVDSDMDSLRSDWNRIQSQLRTAIDNTRGVLAHHTVRFRMASPVSASFAEDMILMADEMRAVAERQPGVYYASNCRFDLFEPQLRSLADRWFDYHTQGEGKWHMELWKKKGKWLY